MAKVEKFRIDLTFDDDMIYWELIRETNPNKSDYVDEGTSYVVSDALFDARREIERLVPEWFL